MCGIKKEQDGDENLKNEEDCTCVEQYYQYKKVVIAKDKDACTQIASAKPRNLDLCSQM